MKHCTQKSIWFALLAVFVLVQPVPAQRTEKYAEEIKIFAEFVREQMQIDGIPGLSIGFAKDDFIWAKGFGYADLENKTPATATSAYRLASVTKTMTAVAVLQLVEKGKLELDAEVQKYVPYFPRKRWPVTVRQLLGHLGGISHYRNYEVEGRIKEHKDAREAIAIFENFDLVAEPGTKFNYSSYGYNLLGAVIEGAAKQAYGDYMRENIWQPLAMNDTRLDDPDELIPNRVRGYRLIDGEVKNSEFVDVSSRFAAGGTRSTVVDLLKFAQGLNAHQVLSPQSIELMYTSLATTDGRLTDYGLGWQVQPINGRFHVSHSGGQPETRTLLVIFPNENFAIALGCNLEGANFDPYLVRLAQLILDERWSQTPIYTADKLANVLLRAMWDVFNFGLSYFDTHQEPPSQNPEELAEAFVYFNKFVNRAALLAAYKEAEKKIRDGRHPVTDQAFLKVGSFMALKLQEKFGAQRLDTYHQTGAIPFFNDYLEIYKAAADYPPELRFSEEFEQLLTQWHQAWRKTSNEYTRRLEITPYADLDMLGENLKKTFVGAVVYPNFTAEFAAVARYFCKEGEREKTFKLANLILELYPEAAVTQVFLANARMCFGEKEQARSFYKKAREVDVEDAAISAAALNRYAYELASLGKWDAGLGLLEIATELYPREPRLYDSIAEFYLEKGKKFYQKALEVDPNFEHARERLKKIR